MKLPADDLYTVQSTAIENGYGKPGFAYFMEMGLGKTRTCYYEFDWLANDGLVDFFIAVSPMSLRGTWAKEAREINYPYPIKVYPKKPKDRVALLKEMAASKTPCGVAIHYDVLLTHGGDFIEELMKVGRVYIALDESIRIKNFKSKVGKRLYEMFKGDKGDGHFRRVLSGRPAPQGVHDLWGQFRFIGLMEKTTFYMFRNKFCRMGGWMGKKVVGAVNLDKLRAETGHAVFRAKKKDWTDLPEKLPAITRRVEMLEEQRVAYLAMMHDLVLEWGDRTITVDMAVSAKQKLSQISTGFVYDGNGKPIWLMDFDKNPKLKDIEDFIDSIESKIVVFYHHKPAKEALEWLLEKHGNEYFGVFLESGLDNDEIERRKELFNTDPMYKVIFCQSSAHKYGHTLLGIQDKMPCCTSYFFENTYNLDTRVQSEDRNHRHGQRYPVTYADVATCREDIKVIEALQKKDRLEDALMSELTGGNIGFDIESMEEW